jgi:RsiW-degrading membrane proteinase PrsW (M82 family)
MNMSNNTKVERKNPSKACYLLPIFFGILGGLAMYFIVRDDNKQMAKNGLILSVILTIMGIILVVIMNVIMLSTI